MNFDYVGTAVNNVRSYLWDFLLEEELLPQTATQRDQFLCPNPNHNDNAPSAKILSGGGKAYCHGCHSTFDIFHLNHWLHGAPIAGFGFITNNLIPLCEKYKVDFELGELSEDDKFKLDSYRAYRTSYDLMSVQLWSDKLREYIEERGLDVETCIKLGIFAVPNYPRFYSYLKEMFSNVFLREIGFAKEAMFSPSSIVFTIKDQNGTPVGFISRDVDHGEKKKQWEDGGRRGAPPRKYDSSPERNRIYFKRNVLFGLDSCISQNFRDLYVFEGQFDWAVAKKNGLENCIALSGSSLTTEHVVLLRKCNINSITLVFDGDDTGRSSLRKLLLGEDDDPGMLTTTSIRISVIELPPNEDPASFIHNNGMEAFHALEKIDSFEWALRQQDPTDGVKACENILPFILAEKSHLRREQMVLALSESTGLSVKAIDDELHRKEDASLAILEREKETIAVEALRELKYGPGDGAGILRTALAKMETLDTVHRTDILSSEETLNAMDQQFAEELALEGPQGLAYGSLTHLQRDLNGPIEGTVIAIGGTANTGKCRRFDDKVLQEDGSFLTIEELFHNQNATSITMSNRFKLGTGTVTDYFDSGIIPTLNIKLDCGLEDHPSLTHPYFTPQGWKRAEELEAGDSIAVVKKYSCFDNLVSPISEDEIIILASLLSEGGLTSGIKYTNQDDQLRDLFMTSCSNLWPGIKFRFEGIDDITICLSDPEVSKGSRAIDFCKKFEILGTKATEKLIPKEIFQCSKQDISLFLSIFFASDGWVSSTTSGREVGISLANQEMIIQLRHLLLRFGLFTKVKHSTSSYSESDKKFNRWTLALRDYDSLSSFSNQIGFAQERKQNLLEDIIDQAENSRGAYRSYPVWNLIDTLLEKNQITYTELCRKAFGEKKVWSMSRWKTQPIYSPRKDKPLSSSALREIAFALEDQYLIDLVDGDVLFSQIIDIKEGGSHQCYDLTIEDTHNFVSNDIVVHNTAIMSQISLETLDHNEDTIVIAQTIDDTRAQFNRRLVVQWAYQYAISNGLDIASTISLNKIANPSFWQAQYPKEHVGLMECREYGWNKLREYVKDGRLHIKDTTHGPTLVLLERLVNKVQKENPNCKIVVALDNFHKLQDFASLDERSSVMRKSQFLKTNIAQGYGTTVFATFEYRKVETGKRPTNNDLRDAVNIEYDINYLIHLFSPLKTAQDFGKGDECDLWHGTEYARLPIVEGVVGKNKITEEKDGIRYFAFYPAQSRYECLAPKDMETIVSNNRSLKAEVEGHDGYWKDGKHYSNVLRNKESNILSNPLMNVY